jgi:hypothetical protein
MGVLQVGDPFVNLYGEAVGEGLSSHQFECPGSCSATFLDEEPVTVIREYLHMHGTGSRMTNEQIRDGVAIRQSNVEVWDFDQNGNFPVKQESFEVQPGDSFRTSCYYRGNSDTIFGLASQEEMCISFIYYYPRKTEKMGQSEFPWVCGYGIDQLDNACNAEYTQTALETDMQLNREFGARKTQCNLANTSETAPEVTESGSETEAVQEEIPISAAASFGAVSLSLVGAALLFVRTAF